MLILLILIRTQLSFNKKIIKELVNNNIFKTNSSSSSMILSFHSIHITKAHYISPTCCSSILRVIFGIIIACRLIKLNSLLGSQVALNPLIHFPKFQMRNQFKKQEQLMLHRRTHYNINFQRIYKNNFSLQIKMLNQMY